MIDLNPLIAAARRVHTSLLPIRWGDMDAMNHLNNVMYLRLMEENRIEWMRTVAVRLGPSKGISPVMMNVYCEYLRPITWPSVVETSMYIGDLGRSSVQTFHTLDVGGVRFSQSAVKLVWMDTQTGKSTPMPDDLRATLSA